MQCLSQLYKPLLKTAELPGISLKCFFKKFNSIIKTMKESASGIYSGAVLKRLRKLSNKSRIMQIE